MQFQGFKPYDYQVFINLGSGMTANGLACKAEDQKIPSSILDLKEDEMDIENSGLDRLTHTSRLYIIGHTGAGGDSISSDGNKKRLTTEELAQVLVKHAPQLQDKDTKVKLKVSIVGCDSAKSRGISKPSFAARLSKDLDRHHIPAKVYGRIGKINRGNGQLPFVKKVAGVHKKEGSKVAFVTKDNVTIEKVILYKRVST